jgi:hypothetical protein
MAVAFHILFLIIAVAVALIPLRFVSVRGVAFRITWLTWIGVWGSLAVATALGFIALSPAILRLVALFGGNVALGTVIFLIFPAVREAVRSIPLVWLVRWQQARVVGGFFLIGAAFGEVSMPFAAIAGIGDIAVGIAAGFTVRQMIAQPSRAMPMARRHMFMGLTDFAIAVSTAILTQAVFGWPYVLIPLFLVPMAALGHLAVLDRTQPRHAIA